MKEVFGASGRRRVELKTICLTLGRPNLMGRAMSLLSQKRPSERPPKVILEDAVLADDHFCGGVEGERAKEKGDGEGEEREVDHFS